ncbi:MAG: acyl-CoA dehydrogenase family protein [Haloechinothrix sp.]
MDFSLTEAQNDLAGLARRILSDWAERTPDPGLTGFDRPLWTSMARAGLLDAALPATVGGGGFGLLEQCSVLIEIGRTVAPAPYLTSVVAAAAAIAEFGGDQHVERWALPVLRGDTTLTVAVADEGSDPGFTAERTAGGWRLSGALTAVPAGTFADGFLCEVCTSDGAVSSDRAGLFVVGRAADGVSVTEQRVVDRTDAALVELDDVVVGDDALLGSPGGGATGWVRQRTTVGWCALQLGIVERALEMTGEYARDRRQFDKPIGSFQAVRQRVADAYLDVEAVRLTLWQAAWKLAEGLPADAEVATAKFWAAQAGHRVAHAAVHIHGGVGIDTDYPLHRYFVAAKRAEFALGGATAHLRKLGTVLAGEPA